MTVPKPAAVLPMKRLAPDPALVAIIDTHESMATELRDDLERVSGQPPVYAEGKIFTAEGATWRPRADPELRNIAASMFQGRKHATTQRDFVQIVHRLHDLTHDPEFFARAPLGVATPSNFWTIAGAAAVENGNNCSQNVPTERLVREARTADQRQRFELPCDPHFDDAGEPVEAPTFAGFLDETFDGPDRDAQVALVQEVFGAALLGLLALLQVAVLLWGKTRAGKGVLVRILEYLFPRYVITSVSPASWGHEYHRAALAGMRLNVVGEVDARRPIPAGDFKSVTGRDLIGARHPTHSPFSFRNEAAHIFSGNFFPPATDRDPAFYIRWRIIAFENSVAGHEDARLSERIAAQELPEVLAWALKGAERVAARGALATTTTHSTLLDRWRVEHSSALSFLLDPDAVQLGADAIGNDERRRDVFEAFRAWCRAEGAHDLGSKRFYAELRDSAARWGVEETRDEQGNYVFRGLRLIPRG